MAIAVLAESIAAGFRASTGAPVPLSADNSSGDAAGAAVAPVATGRWQRV